MEKELSSKPDTSKVVGTFSSYTIFSSVVCTSVISTIFLKPKIWYRTALLH